MTADLQVCRSQQVSFVTSNRILLTPDTIAISQARPVAVESKATSALMIGDLPGMNFRVEC